MNGDAFGKFRFRNIFFVLLPALLFLAAGCGGKKVKSYAVDVRIPQTAPGNQPRRSRLVLSAADALENPNLSRTEEYILREKTPLVTVLLQATAVRMRAAGIEPLQENEKAISSGRLLIVLTRLEAKLNKQSWFGSAALRAERYAKNGQLIGKWKAIGRGAHQDSRLFAGGAGLAMGKAISQALNKLPWQRIASSR